MSVQHPKFWMVWNPQGRTPTAKHWSKAAADAESRRLASLHPDQCFFILKVVGGFMCRVSSPEPVELVQATSADDDSMIPF